MNRPPSTAVEPSAAAPAITRAAPPRSSVAETVDLLRNHPLMPADVTIRGYVINTETGELTPQE